MRSARHKARVESRDEVVRRDVGLRFFSKGGEP